MAIALRLQAGCDGAAMTAQILHTTRELHMDVFHHPYAYAAWHGIDTSVPLPIVAQAADRLAA
jgi:hypothetical protein